MLFVLKKVGKKKKVQNYRKKKVFIEMNLRWKYNNMRIEEEDK